MTKAGFRHCIALAVVIGCLPAIAQEMGDGPYFGQKKPGLTPEPFTPAMTAFTRDFEQCFFEKEGVIRYMEQKDGRWTGPFVADFLGNEGKGSHPSISSDGKILFYNVKGDLWASTRKGKSWSRAEKLPAPLNSEQYECTITFLKDGSVFFASSRPGTKGQCDVFFSKFRKGRYDEPVNMDGFNTPGSECMVLISPNEDYLITTGYDWPGGLGSSDMYISFRAKNGSWSAPQTLGPDFNSVNGEGPLTFSPDGRYFFFGREDASSHSVFWVDAKVMDRYRPGQ
jgi:hypothetical protein